MQYDETCFNNIAFYILVRKKPQYTEGSELRVSQTQNLMGQGFAVLNCKNKPNIQVLLKNTHFHLDLP